MEFSDNLDHSSISGCIWSPDNNYVSSINNEAVIVRNGESTDVIFYIECKGKIDSLTWSPNSNYICIMVGKYIRIFDCKTSQSKIINIPSNVKNSSIYWTPDSKYLLVYYEYFLKMMLYSINGEKNLEPIMNSIPTPKTAKCLEFSKCGKYMAIVHKNQEKENLQILSTNDFITLINIEIDPKSIKDTAGISFSPSGEFIALWDCVLNYNLSLYRITGKKIISYSAYKNGLGIRCVDWSNDSSLLAIGSYDNVIRILDSQYNWNPFTTNQSYDSEETNENVSDNNKKNTKNPVHSSFAKYDQYDKSEIPTFSEIKNHYEFGSKTSIINNLIDTKKPNPKMGISKLIFHPKQHNLFFSFDQTFPNLINCWNYNESELMSPIENTFRVIQKGEINSAQWHPSLPLILVSSSKESKLYFCSKNSCSAVELPETLHIVSVRWNPSGDKILVIGESQYMIAYIDKIDQFFQQQEDNLNFEESSKYFLNKVL